MHNGGHGIAHVFCAMDGGRGRFLWSSIQGVRHIRTKRCDGSRRRAASSCSTIGRAGRGAYADTYASVVVLVRLTARVFSLMRNLA